MATNELQRSRFWADTGSSSAVFDAPEVDEIFTEAGEVYTDAATMTAYTRVIAIRRLMASSAKLTDYTANQSQENLSQVFPHLKELLKFWQDEVADAVAIVDAAAASNVRLGGLRKKPARLKEYPDA